MKSILMKSILLSTRLGVLSRLAAVLIVSLCSHVSVSAAVDVWTGNGTDSNWSDTNNWTGNIAPSPGDVLVFAGTTGLAPNNDFAVGTAFAGINFDSTAGAFMLTGNKVLLSGGSGVRSVFSNSETNGIVNASATTETVSLDVTLDWGVFDFYSPSFTPTALNGALNLNPGAIAYLYPYGVTTTSLTNDANGLISGLGGSGLNAAVTSANNHPIFTGPATVNGDGSISAYSYSDANAQVIIDPTVTNLVSGSNYNVEASANSAVNYFLTNNTYLNTFLNPFIVNVGIMTSVGSNLVMGVHGALLASVNNNGDNSSRIFEVGGGGYLTAGGGISNTPATLVLGVNGAGVGGNMYISNLLGIVDNGTGPVTVVKVGTGSVILGKASTYSGGTYIDQGFIQCNDNASFGLGDVYIASGAGTVLANNNNGVANNFHLVPGVGVPTQPLPVDLYFRGGNTLSGTITLQGPPATYPSPGCRIGLQVSSVATLAGQITGPGTLELLVGATATNTADGFTFSNVTANANNWTGGLILSVYTNATANSGNTNASFTTRLGANNQLAGNTVTMLPIRYTNRFDLNGFSDTIGGLITTPNANLGPAPINVTNVQVVNFGPNPSTLTLGAGNAGGVFAGAIADAGTASALNIVKVGSGTQTLAGPCTHSGITTISGGTLALSNSASLATSPVITIGAGATLDVSAAGITFTGSSPQQTLAGSSTSGTAIINAPSEVVTLNSSALPSFQAAGGGSSTVGKISVSGASANLVLNNNKVTVNVTGSALTAGTYRLMDCTGILTGSANATPTITGIPLGGATATVSTTTGSGGHVDLVVQSSVNTNPTNITMMVVSGNTLKLSWPSDHIGWRLQAETNSLSAGNWFDVAGSSTTNQIFIPIVTANKAVFYRLAY
jgi:autotransporter-associated beta strand protein